MKFADNWLQIIIVIFLILFYFEFKDMFAQSASDKARAWINSNLIDEHANCYVFYKISEEGLNRDTTKPKRHYY
jgi:hypothetical protein